MIVVTPRRRLVHENASPALQRLLGSGEVTAPTELGMPDLLADLAPELDSLSDLLIEDRDNDRRR
ncbi:hypothetical protein GCM10009804_28970 [Kribbella hippodromi]|uniref:Uncharacterized protein n=1 Tax=Kribbella hippodromi TaxID=434347 RepID=A0ABN2D8J9_9ACTN